MSLYGLQTIVRVLLFFKHYLTLQQKFLAINFSPNGCNIYTFSCFGNIFAAVVLSVNGTRYVGSSGHSECLYSGIYLNKEDGTKSRILCPSEILLYIWARCHSVWIVARPFSGHLNVAVAKLSREIPFSHLQWSLNRTVIQVFDKDGVLQAYIYLQPGLTRNVVFIFSITNPSTYSTDVFQSSWKGQFSVCFFHLFSFCKGDVQVQK